MKVRCSECKNYVAEAKKCSVKKVGGGRPATTHPNKPRVCELYSELGGEEE
ncbi:MAG: hypothetical protein ACUVXI_00305 [bacterium]